MNTTPSRSHSSANSGRSATNPQPTHAASARAGDERPLQRIEVEIRTPRSRRPVVVETHGLVGLAHEHRRPFGPGVQGDHPEIGIPAARIADGFVAQLPSGVDESHRCFAAIDDGDSADSPVHRGPP